MTMRFGLIGYGLWGRHHAAAIAKAPGAELAAIACASEATAASARRDFASVPVAGSSPSATSSVSPPSTARSRR